MHGLPVFTRYPWIVVMTVHSKSLFSGRTEQRGGQAVKPQTSRDGKPSVQVSALGRRHRQLQRGRRRGRKGPRRRTRLGRRGQQIGRALRGREPRRGRGGRRSRSGRLWIP